MRLPQMDASARGVGDGVGGGARGVARDEGAGAGAAGRVARRVLSVQHCVRARCARERRGEGVPPARGQAGVAAWGGNTAGATARWVRRTWERAAGRRSYLCACGGRGGVGERENTGGKEIAPRPAGVSCQKNSHKKCGATVLPRSHFGGLLAFSRRSLGFLLSCFRCLLASEPPHLDPCLRERLLAIPNNSNTHTSLGPALLSR